MATLTLRGPGLRLRRNRDDKEFEAFGVGEDRSYWVYIVTNGRYGVLYVGVTNSLVRRIAQHKSREIPGFTRTHRLDRLVFFRGFGDVCDAIHFEKQLKRWRQEWKVRLIEQENPYWADLYLELTAQPPLHPDLREAMAPACG